ncbi:MAG TPA: hypothetical protein VNB22_11220 [Pyrinomonadaceae bacterium]|jgi:hypothetical protein|nr:hypothetical protein [Pyrinomonadaceae bacterium]
MKKATKKNPKKTKAAALPKTVHETPAPATASSPNSNAMQRARQRAESSRKAAWNKVVSQSPD